MARSTALGGAFIWSCQRGSEPFSFKRISHRAAECAEDRERLTRVEATLTGVVIGFAYWDKRTIIRKARDEAKC